MNETRTIPVCNLVAYSLWACTAAALLGGWACLVDAEYHLASMLGLTACVGAAVATTATIRLFALRTHRLIRNLHSLDGQGVGLHSLP